jgi:hypothetical protein
MQIHHYFCAGLFPGSHPASLKQTLISFPRELPALFCPGRDNAAKAKKEPFREIRSGLMRVAAVLFFLFHLSVAKGQVPVTAVVSDTGPAPGELFEITVSASSEIDFYSASAEVLFDNGVLVFESAECGGLSSGGLVVAGELGPGRVGASVTRISALASDAAGPFMILKFRVGETALAGPSEIQFTGLALHNSHGETLETGTLPVISVSIDAGITSLQLLPGEIGVINEGEHFMAEAILFASGITDHERISCRIGISQLNTDPSTWDQESWREMVFDGTDGNDNLLFSAEIGSALSSGDWFIAVRGSLDGGDPVYGGINGMWHPSLSPCSPLTVNARPLYRYILAGWDFDDQTLLTTQSVPANRNIEVQLAGAVHAGFLTGASGLAANSRGWNDGTGVKYWLVEISTSGFTSLELSSRQYGSGTGPRDFAIQYSLDGTSWEVIGGAITVGTNWTSGAIEKLGLPAVLENREKVFLRWVMTSEVSIGEGVTGATGTSRIDNISVTGINPNSEMVTVFAGDANNDGAVNADDVLPLGMYWLTAGPPALLPGTNFTPRIIEKWIPAGATFADTNGDGVVDHKDLLAVGLNFGKVSGTDIKDSTLPLPLSVLNIDPVEAGRVHLIMLVSEEVTALRGVSFSIGVSGVPDEMWETGKVFPAFAGENLSASMLSFGFPDGNTYEGAFAIKGPGEDIHAKSLAGFELIIDERWNMPFTVNLNRLTVSSSISSGEPLAGSLDMTISSSAGNPEGELPGSALLQNHPNPFISLTSIPYRLETGTFVRIEITDTRGRIVDTPFAGFRPAGQHRLDYDGRHLPGGLYLCRMITSAGSLGVIRIFRME